MTLDTAFQEDAYKHLTEKGKSHDEAMKMIDDSEKDFFENMEKSGTNFVSFFCSAVSQHHKLGMELPKDCSFKRSK